MRKFLALFIVVSALFTTLSYTSAQPVPPGENFWIPYEAANLSTTVRQIKATSGFLGYYHCLNPNSGPVFIQLFAVQGTVTLGTTKPTIHPGIPPGSGAVVGLPGGGLRFPFGIQVAATTTATGSTAPTNPVDCNFGYQ